MEITSEKLFAIIGQVYVESTMLKQQNTTLAATIESLKREVLKPNNSAEANNVYTGLVK